MVELVDALRDEIAAGRCVVVVGTGVSSATTRESKASWIGLLESGLSRAIALRGFEETDAQACRALIDSASNEDLMTAADRILGALGGSGNGEFGRWLREDTGYLSRNIRDPKVIEAIGNLDLPVMTTNYDDLVEKVLGRDYITWLDKSEVQRWIQATSNDVLHIHGHWKYPNSIVLTHAQYARLQADDSLNALRQATAATRSMVFVGFGEGLSDPSFGTLREWARAVLPFQDIRHFRLCKSSEVDILTESHQGENIWPVSYGDDHGDLAPFLASLAPSEVDASLTPKTAFEGIEDKVRESAVLSAHVRHAEDARVSDLLMPPVLLPVPNDQYIASVRSQPSSENAKVRRCDLGEEILETHLIVSGDEHSGVTSALLWLCSEMYLQDTSLIPVTVDYLKLGAGPTPLRKRLVKQLRSMGYSMKDADALPRLLLIIDNVNSVNSLRLERVAKELRDDAFERVVVGCRVGSESTISNILSTEGMSFRTRYMGRLTRVDLRGLADLFDSGRSKELTTQAARVVQAHGLAGTPFTLAMILSALMRGESLMSASSPTSLLDAYVDLLLGRGTATDDPRYGLDAANKAHILGRLSEVFVNRRLGALTEFDVVGELTHILDTYGWSGEAIEILADLRDRRILTVRNREVSFTQSSYLYLFAAKRAQANADFLEVLKSDPLYFGPILAHYAALQRNDFRLVRDLVPRLVNQFLDLDLPRSRLFEIQGSDDGEQPSEEEVEERFAREVATTPMDSDEEEDDFTPLGRDPNDPDVPFPLQPVDEEPTVPKAIATLGLVSNLIRDTEIVEDQSERRRLFLAVLRTWGKLVQMIERDPFFIGRAREAAEQLASDLGLPSKHVTRFVEDIAAIIPISIAFGGVSGTLSSGKLFRLIESCLEDEAFVDDPVSMIMANHILFDVHSANWTFLLPVLGDKFSRLLVAETMLRRMMVFAYVRRDQNAVDESRLQDFLVAQAIGVGASGVEAGQRKTRAIQSLKRARLLASARPTDEGDEDLSLDVPLDEEPRSLGS